MSINILSVKSLDLSHIQKNESTQQLFSYLYDLLSVSAMCISTPGRINERCSDIAAVSYLDTHVHTA